jgi:hypothetical protein
MKCPYLMKWLTFACKATKKPYSPSPFQLQEYCKTKSHKKCPFYATDVSRDEIERAVSLPNM